MKATCLFIALLFSLPLFSQELPKDKQVFVRVYDLEGEKIHKGKITMANDSTLFLKKNSVVVSVPAKSIGMIRFKRSSGHNILMGGAYGGVVGGLVGAVSADPDAGILAFSAGEGFAVGAMFGVVVGSAAGALVGAVQNKTEHDIDGDPNKWLEFRGYMGL